MVDCRSDEDQYQCRDYDSRKRITTSKVCDKKCDCQFCDDEGECNGVIYGMTCQLDYGAGEYAPPNFVCDGVYEDCVDKTDETNCTQSDKTCTLSPLHPHYNPASKGVRYLRDNQICAVPFSSVTCSDGRDQVNCTDPERTAMSCLSAGFTTTVSMFAICQGYPLCDDDYNNQCVEVEGGCSVHKSFQCDGVEDCPGAADESKTYCAHMSGVSCTRRVRRRWEAANSREVVLSIPLHWVFDGEQDCEGGEDEDERYWEKCGSGSSVRYLEKGSQCGDQIRCSEDDTFIDFDDLCDRVETCGGENEMCSISRGIPTTWNILLEESGLYSVKQVSYCSRGLENLQKLAGKCHTITTSKDRGNKVSLMNTKTDLTLPDYKTDCRFVYGEMYVYLSCGDSCHVTTPCPLRTIPRDTCVNMMEERISAVTESNQLTVVLRKHQQFRRALELSDPQVESNEGYHNDIFPCDNKNCVLYSEVCNLVDNCGDGSDEVNCTNHFHCPQHDEYIPLTSKCDGNQDCRDYYDECNTDCHSTQRFIFGNSFLRWLSWIVGILATIFNSYNIISSVGDVRHVVSFGGLMNKCFIILISLGDLMMGIYLVLIAFADLHFGSDYCKMKYAWLTSPECSLLGILSTIATQLSLFSMAGLSVFRIRTVSRIIQQSIFSARSRIHMILVIVTISALSTALACIPMLDGFEDFFVNGLYYQDNPLFTGSVSKGTHYQIFRSYFGYFKSTDLSWSTIRVIVKDMFTSVYGG